jgi:predicted deacylase
MPYVIASRPPVATPEAARALGRPIVYVQGNIHAGEVEGKEALQAMLRDLVFEKKRNVLDSIVLVAGADLQRRWERAVRGPGAESKANRTGR